MQNSYNGIYIRRFTSSKGCRGFGLFEVKNALIFHASELNILAPARSSTYI
jgi:hypothetical protein